MVRKRQAGHESRATALSAGAAQPTHASACVVCGMNDARALVSVELADGGDVLLCGSHELMYLRAGGIARTVEELRSAFAERRRSDRRSPNEDGDELAMRLSEAFTTERRHAERRVS